MKLVGKVIEVQPSTTGQSSRGQWTNQGFAIETIEQYPKQVFLKAWNDQVEKVSKFVPGRTQVEVMFEPRSNKYEDKWFTELKAWKIDVVIA
jgi:hypothetical protein